MKRQASALVRAVASLADESGQATTEYVGITFLLMAAGLAATVNFNVFKAIFGGLQIYVSFYFYALNLAVG